jgi:chromosome segregation ATPase
LTDRLDFLQNHFKEADTKNKKQISNLKEENKGKERDLKKSEAELSRVKEAAALLEEKMSALKEDFKTRERDNQEAAQRKLAALEEKMNDLRGRLKRRDEEYNQLEKTVKEEKRQNSDKAAVIEGLEQRLEAVQQEAEAKQKAAQQQARLVEARAEEEKQRLLGDLEDRQRTLCHKEMEVRELQTRLEQAAEALTDLEGDRRKLEAVKTELEDRQKSAEVRMAAMEQEIVQKTDFSASLQDIISGLKASVEAHLAELAAKADCINRLQRDVAEKEAKMADLQVTSQDKIGHLMASLSEKESILSHLGDQLTQSRDVNARQQRELEVMAADVQDKSLGIELLESKILKEKENLAQILDRHAEEIQTREQAIQESNSQLEESRQQNQTLSEQLRQLEEETANLQIRVTTLEAELELKKNEYAAKEAELNWIYEQKLEEANCETRQKVEILKLQEEKLTEIQRQLLSAKQSGEEKDLEIFRREDSIRRLETKLVQSREEVSSKERQLEEKESLLSSLNTSLAQSHEELKEQERVLQVGDSG